MNKTTLETLAVETQIPVELLIKQFSNAGIRKSPSDLVSIKEKQALLAYLDREHIFASDRFLLKRKTRSVLNVTSINGKTKLVQVEVRKKRTLIKQELERLVIEEKFKKNIAKEKINYAEEKKTTQNSSFENDSNFLEKKQEKLKEKVKLKNSQIDKKNNKDIYSEEKLRFKSKFAEIKRKTEEETRRKLEEETLFIAKEARRVAEENENTWNNMALSPNEDNNYYHITTSKHVLQAEEDNDLEIENSCTHSRSQDSKGTRFKKNSSKHLEFKSDREEARTTVRDSKINRRKSSSLQQSFQKPTQVVVKNITIGEFITVSELANKMAVRSSYVIKFMMKLGFMATINQTIDRETAQLVAEEMGHKVTIRREDDLEEILISNRNKKTNISTVPELRAPIVTVMGHVDHGKTSLLDYIRSTEVAAGEAGGITQYIGAYCVKTKSGSMITFLDTPGHAAFTAMRARGAKLTDIVVLVVAADDGVMPQTIESIQHAKAAHVPVVVAVNKIDKSGACPDRVRRELAKYDIVPDDWGGECQFVDISAKTGIGIDKLIDAILLQAEILELKTIRDDIASGYVIESFLDKGRGPVATVLVRDGTLNKGDIIICGLEYGRIRAMRNELGIEVIKAGPSTPVEILGLSGIPIAGDKLTVVFDDKKARTVALYRRNKSREAKLASQQKTRLDNVISNMSEGKIREVNLVLKADVRGTLEAISNSLLKESTEEVKVNIIDSGVGGITETDASLALSFNAILIGFNVRADASARRIIEEGNISLRYYSVIYKLIDEIKLLINGLLSPELKQHVTGLAEIRNVFKLPKFGTIAGCMVIEGIIKINSLVRVLRNNVVVYEGKLGSLRRFKDDVYEVRNGMECGISIKNYNDIQAGDIIEVFETIEIKRSIA